MVRVGSPLRTIMSASQTAALSGLARQAAPLPVDTASPPRSIVIAQFTRSRRPSFTGVEPSTNAPEDALSATVSSSLMFQFSMRLPTTSMAGSA